MKQTSINVSKINRDFPILETKENGKRLTYLDSTATSLKPRQVISAINEYYETYSANVFRGIYPISEKATEAYEHARGKVGSFIGVTNSSEVIFTRNTSESINLVAYSWAMSHVKSGENIVTTIMEHHSNFVPWQQIAQTKNASLKVWNINLDGELDVQDLETLITRKTKLLTFTALSNVLGTINPVKKIIQTVKKLNPNCLVLIDAAQWVPHMSTDVTDWGADFIAFSGHKMLGPTGIGVLWAKMELLEKMSPFLYGGEMIREVHVGNSLFKDPPHKYEAGTPHIAGAIGLGTAVDYLSDVGLDAIRTHEQEITEYALDQMQKIKGLEIYGPQTSDKRGGVIAFSVKNIHAHDGAQILADENICVRAGNHCAMPLHEYLRIGATLRASFYLYTTKKDIDVLVGGLQLLIRKFS